MTLTQMLNRIDIISKIDHIDQLDIRYKSETLYYWNVPTPSPGLVTVTATECHGAVQVLCQ
jgi:hypothetical protein